MKQTKQYSKPEIKKVSNTVSASKVCCAWNASCGSAVKHTKSN